MASTTLIIISAIKVLNEDFHAPMERIADAAGVNKRTLYRYFTDRESLISACYVDMLQTWYDAMLKAYNRHTDPLMQLEEMLYAAIDCGVKYIFLTKMGERSLNNDQPNNDQLIEYEKARDQWFSIVPDLQTKGLIDGQLSGPWIRILFMNIVRTSVQALDSGDVAPNDLKRLSWLCFSRSIGINK